MTSEQVRTSRSALRAGSRLTTTTFAVLLVLPGLALLVAVVLYPLIAALVTAFFRQSLVVPGRESFGLDTIISVLQGDFADLLAQTLTFSVGTTVIPFVSGFALARALNTRIRGANVLRGFFLVPWLIPGVVVSF